jgi:hypothetical protein
MCGNSMIGDLIPFLFVISVSALSGLVLGQVADSASRLD